MVLFDQSEVEGHHCTAQLGQLVVIANVDRATEPWKLRYKPQGKTQSEDREHHNSDPSFESVFGSLFHFYHKFTLLFIKDKLLKFWYLDNTFLINKTPNMSTKILYKQHFIS